MYILLPYPNICIGLFVVVNTSFKYKVLVYALLKFKLPVVVIPVDFIDVHYIPLIWKECLAAVGAL